MLKLALASLFLALAPAVVADGEGQLGMGATLISPVCAAACRSTLSKHILSCSPTPLAADAIPAGEPASDEVETRDTHVRVHAKRRVQIPQLHTAECYTTDGAFLRTLALCLEKFCEEKDGLVVWEIEKWWAGHVNTGQFLGNWTHAPERTPIVPYTEALRLGKEDIEAAGGVDAMPVANQTFASTLFVTSIVPEEAVTITYNMLDWYEQQLFSHTKNTVGIVISSVFLPVLLSLFRFLPGRPLWYSRIVATLEAPLIGHRHRTPLTGDIGYMPTRGQSLYLLYLIVTQIFLCIFPALKGPGLLNAVAPSRRYELLMMIGERSGVIAMGNFVALFLFSSRNNILLWATNWSHSTFLLLHGWIGYATVLQVVIHSILLMIPFVERGTHAAEAAKGYWIWGIAGTLVIVLIWPLAILPIRKKVYEAFLVSHQVLAFATLLCTYYHIFLYFGHDWKFEIWVYVAGLLWAGDRITRVLRLVSGGWRTAVVTPISVSGKTDGEGSSEGGDEFEYIRLDIDGVVADGHVYVYFPTLSWKVWENHPFSVISTFTSGSSTTSDSRLEKTASNSSSSDGSRPSSTSCAIRPRVTIILRPENGLTRTLASRLRASSSKRISLPILVEAAYHSNPTAKTDLAHCSTLLCFAGGVGVTAVVPLLKTFGGVRSRLCWGVRDASLVRALESEFVTPLQGVQVQTSVGERLNVKEILREELVGRDGEEKGDLGVVVCGPASMADDVRLAVAEYGSKSGRGVVFVDEAFSW